MTHTFEIESARTMTTAELLEAFSSPGFAGDVLEDGDRVRVRFEADTDEAQAATDVEHALETWLGEHRLPFVPERAGAGVFVLRPPAG